MEKDRTGKIIAIVALFVGVVGLSVGFAAFSNTLTIQSSATVKPDNSTFNVDFSTSNTSVVVEPVVAAVTPDGLVTTNATINNTSDPKISNLSATFTAPGQKAVYTFYTYNAGELDAYLKSIVYENVTGETTNKVCTATSGTDATLVASACTGISLSVKVGTEAVTTSGISSISGHSLAKGAGEQVTVTLEYAEGATRTDGDFTVSFGDVALTYSSAD